MSDEKRHGDAVPSGEEKTSSSPAGHHGGVIGPVDAQTPEYGALSSQYPDDYDPYVYGRPEPKSAKESEGRAPQSHTAANGHGGTVARSTVTGPAVGPIMLTPENLGDPRRNPVYGRWDGNAVLALVLAVFAVPVLPIVLGALSMRRTRLFHMRGFWMAAAAVALSVITSVLSIWLTVHGVTYDEVFRWMMDRLSESLGESGGTDGTGGIAA